MDLHDVEVIDVTIDPNILKSYEKSQTEYDLCESFCLVCEISSSDEDTSLVLDEKDSNSKDSDKISNSIFTCASLSSDDLEQSSHLNIVRADVDVIDNFTMNQKLIDSFLDLKISAEENDSSLTRLIERGPERLDKRGHKQFSIYYRDSAPAIKENQRLLSESTVHEIGNNFPVVNLLLDNFFISKSTNFCVYDQPGKAPLQWTNAASVSNSDISVPDANTNHDALFLNPNYSLYEDFSATNKGSLSSIHRCETSSSQNLLYPLQNINSSSLRPGEEVFENSINEEDVLESVLDHESITNCIFDPFELSTSNLSAESHKEKIINFLKEGPKNNLADSYSFKSTFRNMSASSVHCFSIDNLFPINNVNSKNVSKKSHRPNLQTRFVIEKTKAEVPIKNEHLAPKISPRTKSASCTNLPPIACKLVNDDAEKKLRSCFSNERLKRAFREVYHDWCKKKTKENSTEIIFVEDDKRSANQSNLHKAVLNAEIGKILCLVELHKQMHGNIDAINIRDKPHKKTALDYAVEKNMYLVVDYLKENKAVCGIDL